MTKNNWSLDEEKLFKASYGKISKQNLLRLFPNRSEYSLYGRARKLGLHSSNAISNRTIFFDLNFFSYPNLENSYWAGFIAADGCIHDKEHRVKIDLSILDKDHLEKFAIVTKHTLGCKPTQNGKSSQIRLLFTGANQWEKDLNFWFNIIPRKSLTLLPPLQLTSEQAKAFLIGYIDGDGSIGYSKNGKYQKFTIQMKGTEKLLLWAKFNFEELLGYSLVNKINTLKTTECKQFAVSGKNALLVYEKLKNICVPKMERKWIVKNK